MIKEACGPLVRRLGGLLVLCLSIVVSAFLIDSVMRYIPLLLGFSLVLGIVDAQRHLARVMKFRAPSGLVMRRLLLAAFALLFVSASIGAIFALENLNTPWRMVPQALIATASFPLVAAFRSKMLGN